ncbi:MAG: DEAD/DEAH box helicase [Candidatus Woesearchaeota archaeon]
MTFKELNLKETTLKAIKYQGFEKPTPIQKSCIPIIKQGKDVVGQSLTGSGKTAAFAIPSVELIEQGKGVQVVVLAPVRELAQQVKDRYDSFTKFTNIKTGEIYGGVSMNPQIDYLKRCEVIVATPGRLLDHIQRGNANFKNVKLLCIDEADKMFEMGFIDDVNKIIKAMNKGVQKALFSATMPPEVHKLIKKHLNNPEIVKEDIHVNKDLLTQVYYNVDLKQKFSLLVHLLKNKTEGLAIVFCGRRSEVDLITHNLKKQGIKCLPVHGGLTQNKRLQAVNHLKKENIQVLVATDVAARGLDINNISHVYNYDAPKNSSEYTHRIGRTARAGEKGEAVMILTHKDHDNFRRVLEDRNLKIKQADLPDFEQVKFDTPPRNDRRRGGNNRGRSGGGGPRRSFGRKGFSDNKRGSSRYNDRNSRGRSGGSNYKGRSDRENSRNPNRPKGRKGSQRRNDN